jgi:hypothetical protein
LLSSLPDGLADCSHDGSWLGAAGVGVAQLVSGSGAGFGAAAGLGALGAADLGAADLGAADLATAAAFFFFAGAVLALTFFALAFLADFFGAAFAFLADFFADFLAFFADFFEDFFADFFFAVRSFLFFLAFLPFLFFLPLAIVIPPVAADQCLSGFSSRPLPGSSTSKSSTSKPFT